MELAHRMDPVVVFELDGQLFALPLSTVERAVRVVEVTPLPRAPEIVCGVINVHGRIVPVVNARRRFGMPEREVMLSDQLLIARTPTRTLAMRVDAVTGVVECSETDFVAAEAIVPGTGYVKGILRGADRMILVHDLDTFLSLEEAQSLDKVIGNA